MKYSSLLNIPFINQKHTYMMCIGAALIRRLLHVLNRDYLLQVRQPFPPTIWYLLEIKTLWSLNVWNNIMYFSLG